MYALLIAQDADDVAIFSMVLQRAGLAVTAAKDLNRAMQTWSERPADIILLSLPDQLPLEQINCVRAETQVPLILVVNQLDERLLGDLLRAGADLVIGTAFSAKLLIAQVTALMRRAGTVPTFSLPTLKVTGLTLDPTTRTVEVDGKPLQRLTHLEFRLLYTLMINRDQVIPTETLVERVWGYTGQGDRDLVRGLVSRLRGKVETDPRQPQYILTVSGVGYSFQTDKT
ncbi:MAG: response regulator transcription factor [Anaerolineae bacterium]|nr:response regulator transcription factor [Anaerolineae bacterium]